MILMMEESKTKDIILALLRLENRWGQINLITKDAGTDVLEGNLNPKIEGETDGDTRRLLGNVEERTCETDSLRNYCEWSVQLLKTFVREITGTRKITNCKP